MTPGFSVLCVMAVAVAAPLLSEIPIGLRVPDRWRRRWSARPC